MNGVIGQNRRRVSPIAITDFNKCTREGLPPLDITQ